VFPEGLQGVALHPEVYRQVSASRCQARVAQIVANRHQVGPGLQERRGRTVTQHVRGDALARERRSISGGDGRNVLVEDVGDAVAGQGLAAVIDEDVLLVPTGIHAAQAVQGIGGLAKSATFGPCGLCRAGGLGAARSTADQPIACRSPR
jgi:hypothetical protein